MQWHYSPIKTPTTDGLFSNFGHRIKHSRTSTFLLNIQNSENYIRNNYLGILNFNNVVTNVSHLGRLYLESMNSNFNMFVSFFSRHSYKFLLYLMFPSVHTPFSFVLECKLSLFQAQSPHYLNDH